MNKIHFRSLFALVIVPTLFACDNPVSDDEDHTHPDGIVIRAGATELIRVVGFGDDAVVTGALIVEAGAQTQQLTATYIDHDG